MADKQTDVQWLELVDGLDVEACIMTEPSALEKQCAPNRHCARHGSGPFTCCKCGAQFMPVEGKYVGS